MRWASEGPESARSLLSLWLVFLWLVGIIWLVGFLWLLMGLLLRLLLGPLGLLGLLLWIGLSGVAAGSSLFDPLDEDAAGSEELSESPRLVMEILFIFRCNCYL